MDSGFCMDFEGRFCPLRLGCCDEGFNILSTMSSGGNKELIIINNNPQPSEIELMTATHLVNSIGLKFMG